MILRPDMKQRWRSDGGNNAVESGEEGVDDKQERKEQAKGQDKIRKEESEEKKSMAAYTYLNRPDKYWWTCYAGAQNDGKGCTTWQVMNFDGERRGPGIFQVPGARCIG